MSRYDALTAVLMARTEPEVKLSFDELDGIVGGLPASARSYHAWWANNRSSQPHAKAWLDANRRATPDFRGSAATFARDESSPVDELSMDSDTPGHEALVEYVESTISLERDLEEHLARQLEKLEPGLTLVGRQQTIDVGRIDILARDATGRTVIIELKVGEARDAAIGQIARYLGWFARRDEVPPRAFLIAGSFPEPVRYAAVAVTGLRLVSYRVSFDFDDASL